MGYYLVQRDIASMGKRKGLLVLSVYMRGLPICCENSCCCCSNDGCINIISKRAKHLFYSGNMFLILIYHIFIRTFITIFSTLSVLLCGYCIAMVSIPIWYGIDDGLFDDRDLCPFGARDCDKGWKHCDCNVLSIDNIWTAIGFAVCGFVVEPFKILVTTKSNAHLETNTKNNIFSSDSG